MTGVRDRSRVALLACVVFASACGHSVDDAYSPAGVALPEVRLTDIDGTSASLDTYRGRVLVLNLWATWCGPCRKELPSLDRLSTRLDANRFAVAGVTVDSDRVAVREYLLQHAIRFPNFVAADRLEIQVALAARTLPQTLVIATDGSLIERIEGARNWDSAASIARIETAWLRDRGSATAPAAGDPVRLAAGPSPAEGYPSHHAGMQRPSSLQPTRPPG